jgi:hypothetical protein
MRTNEQLVYVVVLLRIYDNGGSCPDSFTTLAKRTDLTHQAVRRAIEKLTRSGRLRREKTGEITNPLATEIIERDEESRRTRGAINSQIAKDRWRKHKQNQRNDDTNRTPVAYESHRTRVSLSSSLSSTDSKLGSEDGVDSENRLPLEDSLGLKVVESERSRGRGWSFDEFWRQYPHKVGKRAALKSFEAARKRKASFEDLMLGLMRYSAKDDDRPWCNPSTWLNQERWLDEPAANGGSNVKRDETIAERTARLVERAREAEDAARRAGRSF